MDLKKILFLSFFLLKDGFKLTILHDFIEENPKNIRKMKNHSFFQQETQKNSKYLKKRENVKKFFIDNLKGKVEKSNRIHDLFKNEEFAIHKKRLSFSDLPLKYFSENIKNSNFLKKFH